MPGPIIDHDKCNGDEECFNVCPSDPNVFEIRGEGDNKNHMLSIQKHVLNVVYVLMLVQLVQ